MKNHERVNGKLLQTNKKYSHLKLKQKERIHQWMYDSYKKIYQKTGRYPGDKETDEVLFPVMEKIESADIWIPYREVARHYHKILNNLKKRLKKEMLQNNRETIILEVVDWHFSVCKVSDFGQVNLEQEYVFTGRTDKERSLVCPEELVPDNTIRREDGWRAFRICGELDFSLIGILARISKILASNLIGIFAISTYDTDYILTKEENFEKALQVLKNSGYQISSANKEQYEGE